MAQVDEIAPDVYRISIYVPDIGLTFNHFLVRDDEPLLFHAGLRGMFPELRDAVVRLVDPASIRHIGFSHFESDECGALNQWLGLAPRAEPVCGLVGALVSVNDFAMRTARVLGHDDVLITGKRRFRLLATPHLPHGWDASLLFEETDRTLFCSDLFLQSGAGEPLSAGSILDRVRTSLIDGEAGPFAHAIPYTHNTGRALEDLACFAPRTLAIMHGSSYAGDGAAALRELAIILGEVLG
ncbi:oxygen-binding di-iron domain-containing protein [Acidiphilium iwatense]|uniref:MBL fold metallo-hydrolase n=1 Tax=Acidiphilium iwatense TaxID=768198 RepID=A0ABS9DUT5_9PROT|nr:MBL fold metallo-hydrolase [Acidiphilium iwatense]MCF3945237.1 MBL fold metallo-hydrolase [Acidiphilium iwatense]